MCAHREGHYHNGHERRRYSPRDRPPSHSHAHPQHRGPPPHHYAHTHHGYTAHHHHQPHYSPSRRGERRSRSPARARSPERGRRGRSRSRSPGRWRARTRSRSASRSPGHRARPRLLSPRRTSSSSSRSWSRSRSRSSSGSGGRTGDTEGHLHVVMGAELTPRYKILAELGEGTFGRVLECFDRHTRTRVAVKVVRALDRYTAAARIEVDVLRTLQKHDPTGKHGCVQLLDEFDFQRHVCMVFEKLGPSLYDKLQEQMYRPFAPAFVHAYTRQLLQALAFVHRHSLVHTDLKPENLLLANDEKDCKELRLIDFGSATFEHAHHTAVVGTRHYRAPEVILGLGWTYPCDMWSVGCIVLELYTGEAVFQTHDNAEHLCMMQRLLGPLPPDMVARAAPAARALFGSDGRVRPPAQSSRHLAAVRPLHELIAPRHAPLLALLRLLLTYDPARRVSAHDALVHPYVRDDPVG